MVHQLQKRLVGIGFTARQIGIEQDGVAVYLICRPIGITPVRGLKGGIAPGDAQLVASCLTARTLQQRVWNTTAGTISR